LKHLAYIYFYIIIIIIYIYVCAHARACVCTHTHTHTHTHTKLYNYIYIHIYINNIIYFRIIYISVENRHWIEGSIHLNTNQKDLVHIAYSSLNFKDIMLATGKLGLNTNPLCSKFNQTSIGLEYVGIDTAGRRVMGLSCRK